MTVKKTVEVSQLKIGQVAKQTGIAVGALRYYEELGLLKSSRGPNGYRYYDASAVHQVQFIKKAQALGFSLEEVGEVLSVHAKGKVPCQIVRSHLDDKIAQLEATIQSAIAFKQELEHYRDQWNTSPPQAKPDDICPLIETVPLDAGR